MKTLILSIFLMGTFATSTYAKTLQVSIEAEGFQEIEIGSSLNPFASSTVERATNKAKKNLKKKCKDQFDGKIVNEINTELLRYDTGIMGALVLASGTCEFEN